MVATLANWILSALGLLIVSNFVPGFEVSSFTVALIVALVLGVVNAVLKPVITILTLPINILTFGLFSFVVNAALIWGVSLFINGFSVTGFIPALFGAIILGVINLLIHFVVFPLKAV